MHIRLDDITHPHVLALLELHMAGMMETSPKDSVYALDVSGLKIPEVSFWTAWQGDELMGCGALKELSFRAGEIKSMRTDPAHIRKGVAAAILEHILDAARQRGYKRLSLETGSGSAFDPALSLYRKYGFTNGEAFGDYKASAFNQFLHLDF